jgi:predicted Zn-dependent peptidase
VAHALHKYIQHGEKSPYLDRLRLKDIKKLEPSALAEKFQEALGYTAEIHYAGKLSLDEVKETLQENFVFQDELQASTSPVTRPVKEVKEDMVYFVEKKDALQSKIYLYSLGKSYNPNKDAYRDAFNMYFGGGFSGIVLQEIREYRSLAYTAGATYRIPPVPGKPCVFLGYVGTQADKSIEALTVFKNLYKDMPQKPGRANMIKKYLQLSLFTDRPSFRAVSKKMVEWRHLGYPEDPAMIKMQAYQDMNFSDIYTYYQENIQENPLAIGIVGDKKAFDLDGLKEFGKLKKVKEKHLFTK